ncbi:sugar phosphate isomerase/epimerase [Anaerosolibacter carboniphilus]|uniref:Sugar phosphate isomerase/epimerase n=1 Tax=Anaerosolibacter carboniphilus TaxID=1417629 RepID=A0A841L4N4_9FIRM|nr:sugar phosphate isomerase/epimerase family protein [Anaerosolibacter carboniphilus]MBB6217285.1 sugar phosphate isomerase/epimerase [Anaerosolibacter carboniphilus]
MKLAVAIAGENALPSAFVVWRGFRESMRKASEFGYHGVELALKTADDVNPHELHTWLSQYNLEVSCISTGQVFAALGLYFTHPDRVVRERAIEVFNGLIYLAKDFGKIINVGRTRGFIAEGQTYEQAEKLFLDTAERICETAEKNGVTIILEPVNRYEINFINSLDEGAELASKLKHKNIGLMPDVFHMNIEDDRIGASLVRNASMIKYIHFADSNRLAPGQGHLDFDDVFNGLRDAGFDGWASIEILAKPDPDTAARQAAEFILPRIEAYNRNRIANK